MGGRMQLVDGYGNPVRLVVSCELAALAKAGSVALPLQGVSEAGPLDEWTDGDLTCSVRPHGRATILTIMGKGLPMPYHMVVKDTTDARYVGRDAVKALRKGQSPKYGVFRRVDAAPIRWRAR